MDITTLQDSPTFLHNSYTVMYDRYRRGGGRAMAGTGFSQSNSDSPPRGHWDKTTSGCLVAGWSGFIHLLQRKHHRLSHCPRPNPATLHAQATRWHRLQVRMYVCMYVCHVVLMACSSDYRYDKPLEGSAPWRKITKFITHAVSTSIFPCIYQWLFSATTSLHGLSWSNARRRRFTPLTWLFVILHTLVVEWKCGDRWTETCLSDMCSLLSLISICEHASCFTFLPQFPAC